ncbi:MAG: molecular chaperone [Acidiferrobacterales bacterium]
MAQKTIERSNVYGLLATIYRQEPTADLLQRLTNPPFLRALSAAGVALERDCLDRPQDQLLASLSLEYTRLFIGPGKHISPHESVHTPADGGSLWGKSTVAVKQFIESVGVEFRPEYHGIPDHISVELEFMQEVTDTEAQAWQREDRAQVVSCLQIEKKFISEHLAQWVPRFCEKVIEEAELSFYREMAILTRNFIESDKEEIEQLAQEHLLQ